MTNNKELHYVDEDTQQVMRVKCHLDIDSIPYSFFNWVYSLKLDSLLSGLEMFQNGFHTGSLNRVIYGVLSSDDSFINLEPIYKLLKREEFLKNPAVASVITRVLDFFVVDDICSYSSEDYNHLVSRIDAMDVATRSFQKRNSEAISYNSRILSAIQFDPYHRKEESTEPISNSSTGKVYQIRIN